MTELQGWLIIAFLALNLTSKIERGSMWNLVPIGAAGFFILAAGVSWGFS